MVHVKRYVMPRFWGLERKAETFAITPRGSHPRNMCIPLRAVIRDILSLAGSAKEATRILHEGQILVDKKVRKDPKHGIGLMDILEIPALKKTYRVEVNSHGLVLAETTSAAKKLCRIIGKTIVRGGKIQLNLHDGRNLLAEKAPYAVGDTVQISLPDQKIEAHFALKKGAEVLVISGRNRGVRAKVTAIAPREFMMSRTAVSLESKDKKLETLKDYVFVIKGGS